MDAWDLEPRSLSVYSFCDQANDLLEEQDFASFVRFVLTGRHDNRQVVIDSILNRIPSDEDIGVMRDYDSLLGIDKNIRLTCPLTVYPVSKEDVLSKNIHIYYNFTKATVRCHQLLAVAVANDSFVGKFYSPSSLSPQHMHWKVGGA